MRLILCLLALLLCPLVAHAADTPATETAYDRVMRTGIIRCGYGLWEPMLRKDANTGEMSGTWYDVTTAMANALSLKVEWTMEANMATYLEDMHTGKFDVECGGGWPNAERGKFAEYSVPAFFFALYPYVRADDARFDNDYSLINKPDVTVATMDGETPAQIRAQIYPQSKAYELPPTAPISDIALSVVTHKADIAFFSSAELESYLKLQPGSLRLAKGQPLRVIPQSYSVGRGEFRLKAMLDTALNQLLYDGTIEAIISKHETVPGTYLRVAPAYQTTHP